MFRSLSTQPSPYWVLTLLMWSRLPLFPNGAHRFVDWPFEDDIFVLKEGDNVIFNERKSFIKKIKNEEGKPTVFTIGTVLGDNMMEEKEINVDRDEILPLYDHRWDF